MGVEGGPRGKGYMYTYTPFTLLCRRNQHNIALLLLGKCVLQPVPQSDTEVPRHRDGLCALAFLWEHKVDLPRTRPVGDRDSLGKLPGNQFPFR